MATKKAGADSGALVEAKINPSLDSLARPLSSLKNDARNARRHERRSIETIKTSLATYGQQKPIVALSDGVVIAGNGTLAAARELGWDKIAVVVFDTEDEARARAFAIMDNRSSELSSWDHEELAKQIADLNHASIGFTEYEAKSIASLLEIAPYDVQAIGDDDGMTAGVVKVENVPPQRRGELVAAMSKAAIDAGFTGLKFTEL